MLEYIECLRRCKRQVALSGQVIREILPARHVTDSGQDTPGDAQTRTSAAAAVVCECVEIGVGCRVVALQRVAKQGGDRREHDEQIERVARRLRVQVPRAGHLWRQHPLEPRPVHLVEPAVIEHHGRMHDAAQWRHGAPDRVQDAADVIRARDVPLHDFDPRAAGAPQAVEPPHRLRARRSSSGEDERTSAALHQPFCGCHAESAEPSRDEVGAVAPEAGRARRGSGDRHGGVVQRQHDLANMPRLCHEAHRVLHLGDRPHALRQRLQPPFVEPFGDLAQQRADELRPLDAETIQVDGVQR